LNSNLIHLIKLQKIDERLGGLKKIEAEGPLKIEEIDQELAAAELLVQESLQSEKEMLKRRLALEGEIEDTDRKMQENQTRQLRVKTNEEYRAMLKESEFMRKANAAREDEVLELMEQLEKIGQENKRLKRWLQEQRENLAQKRQEVQAWIETSLAGLGQINADRTDLVASLSREHITLYERVYNKRNGKAVTPILDGICQECHLKIPPQKFIELQKNDQLMTCPHCGRIIFWGGHEDYLDL